MVVIGAEIHKMLVRIANVEAPDQTASSALLSRPFWQAIIVRNFRTFTIPFC